MKILISSHERLRSKRLFQLSNTGSPFPPPPPGMHIRDTVFLDFKKAFDSVSHKCLLYKLERLGVSGNVLKWISSFLSNRQQSVVINGQSSEWTDAVLALVDVLGVFTS